MTTTYFLNKKSLGSSPPAIDPQKLSLPEQIKFTVLGHGLDDVAGCAVGLLLNCLAIKGNNKQEALRYLDLLYVEMRKAFERDYDSMVTTMETFEEH
jgi:hypothetical protein